MLDNCTAEIARYEGKITLEFYIRRGSMVQQEVYTLSIGNGRGWHDAYFGIGSGPNLTLTIALHCPTSHRTNNQKLISCTFN